MDVRVDSSCCDNKFLSSDDFGGRANDHVGGDVGHHVWVPSLANTDDHAFRDTNIRLDGMQELEIRQPAVVIRYPYLVDTCPINN